MHKPFAAGGTHSLFLTQDYEVYASGLEDENDVTICVPTLLPFPANICSVHAGTLSSMCLDCDGNVWGMGSSAHGQLGLGSQSRIIPTKVENLPAIKSIAVSLNYSSFFLDYDGNAYSCGSNSFGQLGHTDAKGPVYPSRIENLPKIKAIIPGSFHTIFQSETGDLFGCGYNESAQVNINNPSPKIFSPVKLESIPVPIESVSCGRDHSLFKDIDGNAWSCGSSLYGQLGTGQSSAKQNPIQKIANLPKIVDVSAGRLNSQFLDTDGNLWSCGDAIRMIQSSSGTPVKYTQLTGITKLDCSTFFLLCDANSRIWASGNNMRGELGLGDKKDRKTPQMIEKLPLIATVSETNPNKKSARK